MKAATPPVTFFLRRIIAYKPLLYGLVSLFWILFHSWPLLLGLLAKVFFEVLEGRAPARFGLTALVALVLAAGLAKAGVILGAALSGVPWSFYSKGLLRRNLLACILERPGAKAVPGSVGEALSTFRDDVDMVVLMSDWVFDAVAGIILAGGGVTILLMVDARVTLLVFIPIVIVIMLAQAARSRLEQTREASREATASVTGAIGEIFGAAQAVQVAGAEARMVAHLRRLGDERRAKMLRDRLQGLALDAVFSNTASLGSGLTLLVAASYMRSGTFSVGDFALFATYLMQVADYTGFLGYLVATYRQSGVSFRRVLTLMQGAPAERLVAHHPVYLRGGLPPLTQRAKQKSDRLERLEVRNLTFQHPGSGQGIEDVTFSLERGTLTVVTGRVGSGKTTLLRATLGLLSPQAGEVAWNGRYVAEPARFMIPPRVAYTAQVPTLISGRLRENILLGLRVGEERLGRAVRMAVLERDLESFADGLETVVGARGVKLSGGQVQRAAAARMFVHESELLVVDDLSSALDVETESLLWQRIFERGTTCLAVSHRRSVLEKADHILVLESGRLVAQGSLVMLLATNMLVRQLYGAGSSCGSHEPNGDDNFKTGN